MVRQRPRPEHELHGVRGEERDASHAARVLLNQIRYVRPSSHPHKRSLSLSRARSRVRVLDRVQPPVLPVRGVRRADREQRPRVRADRCRHAERLGGEPAEQHGEPHGDAHDARVRARSLQPAGDVRRLCRGVPQLALRHLAPTLRRVYHHHFLADGGGDDYAGAVGAERVKPAESKPARVHRLIHGRAAMHRGVQRRGPRVPAVPRLPLPAPAVHREPELRRRLHRRERGGRGCSGLDGRGHGSLGERVV